MVRQLRHLVQESGIARAGNQQNPTTAGSESTPKYRVKRDFDEVDKSGFRDEAFKTIRNYFEKSTAEIRNVPDLKSHFTSIGDDGFSCTVVNRLRDGGVAHMTVYSKGGSVPLGDITYSFAERAERGTMNGWFQIEADDYELYLKQNAMTRVDDKIRLSPKEAALLLWEEFLQRAGISHA